MFFLLGLPEDLEVLHFVPKYANDMTNNRNRWLDKGRLSWISRRRQQSPEEDNHARKNEQVGYVCP